MCGICGIVNTTKGPVPDKNLLLRMMGRLSHRGPDSSGYYRDTHAALGHTRLAIIDVQGGAQPLCNEDGSVWITFNGEIYNYVELASELKALGHIIKTKTDTEVIIHSYEEWGTGCFERFNGQWAFVLWDNKRQRLIASRDRFGIRPLHYTLCKDRFLFASEIKALFADPEIERRFDFSGLAEIFTFWCPVAPRTAFDGVYQLKPGHFALIENGSFQETAFWEPVFPEAGKEPCQNEEKNEDSLRRHLIEASRLRFVRSDVPVGAYLSGGIDSSVTSAVVTHYTEAPLRTYSIRFSDSEFDEGRYQQEMSNRLESRHESVTVSYKDIGNIFPQVVWHAEQPLLRTAPAPLFLLSRLVRESGHKVVVTGEGADEVLAGYDLFREAKARQFMARNTSSGKRADILFMLYPWMARSPARFPAFGRAFFRKSLDPNDPGFSHRPRWGTTSMLLMLLNPELKREIEEIRVDEELLSRTPDTFDKWDSLGRAQWLEMTTLLSGYILSAQGDRMLMAHSVEGRFPFLDYHLVDFANALPARHKLLALNEKHLLKVAFNNLLPDSILHRPKQPYRAPDAASFFFDGTPEWIEDIISEENLKRSHLFQTRTIQSMIKKCRGVKGMKMSNTDNMRIVAVLSLLLLQQKFIEKDGRGESSEIPPGPMKIIDYASNN